MTDQTKLLPCPFCGGEAKTWQGESLGFIYCSNPVCGGEQSHDTIKIASELWNTRANALPALEAGAFLLARIDELDWSLSPDDFAREHAGHVDPAIARFRAALSQATAPGEG